MEHREELVYWVWMAEALGAGSRVGLVLLRKFGSVRKIYSQTPEAAAGWSFLSQKEKAAAVNMLRQKDLRNADRILERCMELGIRAISYDDGGYPEALRAIQNPPVVLYAKGALPMVGKRFTAAVVGTRTMSDYGRKMAYSMGYGLAAGGALVVSGMALGVDSMAMMGALDAGGITVAVLGGGADIVYPKEHIHVYRRILETGGCILSEYAPGTEPKGAHFPVRNRIISGLSDAGVVVEGDSKSGALITARYLLYQGRKLFAVPGQVGLAGSEGPNSLICDGALPAITAEDILSEFKYMFPYSIS
ncbi:MAG: DNA-processing protein DprA, partial [Clostridia bacterium]|nr:DNA-processing protein DprA [Clostridia bacterium]